MSKVDSSEELEFKWGKMRGAGLKDKNVQFYESFCYDGMEYNLYDCVYLYKEGEPGPYIGKLVKIWEHATKGKKVKVHWFFRPSEISYYLKDEKVVGKELFLASGKGVGVFNINPLEAVAGKCSVICVSKDSRNPQPSSEEMQMADYVFYRTFNVGSFTISDEFGEKVGDYLEVKFIFNRKSQIETSSVDTKNIDSSASNGRPAKRAKLDNLVQIPEGKDTFIIKRSSESENEGKAPVSGVISSKGKSANILRESDGLPKDVKKVEGTNTSEDRPAKKIKLEAVVKTSEVNNKISVQKLDTKSVEDFPKDKVGPSPMEAKAPLKLSTSLVGRDNAPPKGEPNEKTSKLSVGASNSDVANVTQRPPNEKTGKLSIGTSNTEIAKGSQRLPNEKTSKPSVGASSTIKRTYGEIVKVTQRPNPDKSTWFKELPWEERIQSAQDEGKLVLLQNLDPEYTSGEVEDIVFHAFGEHCTAKVLQHTAASSPHSGRALVIFKSKEAADKVIIGLHEGCLMLSNARPLIGRTAKLPKLIGKQASFVGHLSIDKVKYKMGKEMREAVSTSHYSQPNTLEYEMAMDWFLLQARSENCWKQLYEQQARDIEKLKGNLKLK